MPTGYTAKLYEGIPQTFVEFVLGCARAFGALIELRDEPNDTPIPEKLKGFDSGYYDRSIERHTARIHELEAMTGEQIAAAAWENYQERLRLWHESVARANAIRHRYQAMLDQVLDWEPPTEDHIGLRKFMVDQLTESINHDGQPWPREEPKPIPPEEWLRAELEMNTRGMMYDSRHKADEAERTAGRQKWIDDLRASLGITVS